MNQATFTRAGTGPRPFTIAIDGQYELHGLFDLELGACRYALLSCDENRIEEFTDYEAARARFIALTEN